jgi:hypothetical protein
MAIGDWDDTRNASVYQAVVEHEEFDLTAEDQWRLLVGYDRHCCATGEDWINFTAAAWTEASWFTILYIRDGLAWDCLGAWIYVNANVGTNYLKLEIRDGTDSVVASIPSAAGVTITATGWKEITKCFSTGLGESNVTAYSVAVMGRCPAGSMEVGYLNLYFTSSLEP